MPHRPHKIIVMVLVCLIGLLPFSAATAAFTPIPVETTSHHDLHSVQHMAEHCRQHIGNNCDSHAACSTVHCFTGISAIFPAAFLILSPNVTLMNPATNEIPPSATPSPLFRPPKS